MIHTSSCLQFILKVIGNVLFIKEYYYLFIKKPKKLGSLAYATCIEKNPYNYILMKLHATKNIHFLYIFIFLDSLLEELQEFPTSKQIISLKVGLKWNISYYNHDHIIRE